MVINNLLYIDDSERVRSMAEERLREGLSANVDMASSYESGLEQMRKKFCDLVVADGLHGRCFQLAEEARNIRHGRFVIFSLSAGLAEPARMKGIPFYRKPEDLDKLISDFAGT